MLEPLGVTTRAEAVYRALLAHGPSRAARLAAVLDLDADDVRKALDELAELGLAATDPGAPECWHAASPEVSLAELVVRHHETLLERQRDLDRAQQAVGDLVRLTRSRGPADDAGLVVTADADAVARRCAHLARSAETSVLVLDTRGADPGAEEPGLVRRGVDVQTVHERLALLEEGRFETLRRLAAAGGQVRTLPSLPMSFTVYDRREAVVHLDAPDGQERTAVFVRQPALLGGLVTLFDLLWERAVPLPPAPDEEPAAGRHGEFDDVLVALLAAGFKDESIARHLGISPSTVTRRMARLMEVTGTSTRFQLGMQAVRKGWI
jgi:sugar-specific transcriptional regulator TrmB